MRVFVAGATGVIGIRLVPLLVAEGHDVTGMTRSAAKAGRLAALGCASAVCDVFDLDGTRAAVGEARPEAIVSLLTDLPDEVGRIAAFAEANARIRREGTANLLTVAAEVGAERFLVESVAWKLSDEAGTAVAEMERSVLAAGGVVVRYGQLYGRGTYFEAERPDHPRIHIDDAARRTVPLLLAPSGVVELVDGYEG